MKKINIITVLTALVSIVLSFNIFAMPKNRNANEPVRRTPYIEVNNEDRTLDYEWVWLNDDVCVQFKVLCFNKSAIEKQYELGMVSCWSDEKSEIYAQKKRDTYAGKWSQDASGVWSFEFDDCTIPVGLTKIDDIIYAFNTYGELKEGYNYWGDLKTSADGLVVTDNPEFTTWMATQYIPDCTSHE